VLVFDVALVVNHASLANEFAYATREESSAKLGCSLGKRKFFPHLTPLPSLKTPCYEPCLPLDDEWYILFSNAKQPNLDVVRSRNGRVSVSSLCTMAPAKPKVYRTLGIKEGEGTYGSVFRVFDAEAPHRELVMKISVANSNFFAEVSALSSLNRKQKTPNIPLLHDWFISDQLPPNNRYWGAIVDKLRTSSQFKSMDRSKYPFGFLIVEKANCGSLSNFFENHLARAPYAPQEAWRLIDSIIFQLVFTAAALPESQIIHRDIGGSNIMLTTVTDASRWWYFRVGKQLFRFARPSLKPVLIDYGSAHVLDLPSSSIDNPRRVRSSLRTDFRYTTLRYRAPEMIFLSSASSGPLQPIFTPATDLFSIAMSILEMITGDFTDHKGGKKYQNHPFLRHEAPPILAAKLKEFSLTLKSNEKNFNLNYADRSWSGMLHSGFITVEESSLLARYLWGMYMELGIPNNRKWQGVESTGIWCLMDEVISIQRSCGGVVPSEEGLLLSGCDKLRQFLSPQQLACLLSMLRYNPKHRPSPAALLKSEIFDEFRVLESETEPMEQPYPCWSVNGAPLVGY